MYADKRWVYHLKNPGGENPFIFCCQSDDGLVIDNVNPILLKECACADVRST